jgi:hypothetical protein
VAISAPNAIIGQGAGLAHGLQSLGGMNTGTGVLSIVLAMGALLVTASNSKSAEARSSYSSLKAFRPQTTLTALQGVAPVPANDAVSSAAPIAVATPAPERISPPHLLENRGLRRLRKAETSPAMLTAAAQIVRRHYSKPVGTEITVEVEGQQVIARIERHFHPEGGSAKPWGFHPGVSLFIER